MVEYIESRVVQVMVMAPSKRDFRLIRYFVWVTSMPEK